MNQNQESVLLRTSLATDSQGSGGNLIITGLTPTKKTNISQIVQIKSRSEVSQVVRIGGTAYTPTGSTRYAIEIGDTNRIRNGAAELLKVYSFTTPADITQLGATAALQREAIHAALVLAVNADTKNFVTAASLGGGTGLTITDNAGYYPPFSQTGTGRLGASQVLPMQNPDDSGFLATNVSITTAAVYESGIGANMALGTPVVDALYGGLLSGYLKGMLNGLSWATVSATAALNNLPPVSGQTYDIFIINSLTTANAHNQRGQLAYVPKMQAVAVDNGAGTSTTNLAGFVAFEREMIRAIANVYDQDQSAIYDFFDNGLIASATYPTTGAAVSTTDNVVMALKSSQEKYDWYVNPIGAHTLISPIVATGGLQTFLDATTQEGLELSAPNLTQNPKQFVVGKTEASFYCRFNIGTGVAATSYKTLSIGFRKKAAYAVDQTAYEAASVATACIGIPLDTGVAPVWNTITGPGTAGAITNTSTGVTATVSTAFDILITVDINGVTKFYLNGVDRTPAAGYTFTAGLNLMPFVSFRHGAAADAVPLLIQTMFLPSITWRG